MARPEDAKPLPSRERLVQLLEYFPETGEMKWRARPLSSFSPSGKRSAETLFKHYHTKFAGKPAGSRRSDGYDRIMIDEKGYKRSRIAWKIMTGDDPLVIDHINGDRSDDRFSNLRNVTPKLNARNAALYANNTSGVPGVEFSPRDNIWVAKIGSDGKQIHLGNFKTKGEAIACRIGAEIVLGYHENHGRASPLVSEEK